MRFALVLSILCAATAASAEPDALSENRSLLPPIQIDALIVVPIVAADGTVTIKENAITLDEAFAKKLVTVVEHDVMDQNNLTLTNRSDRPLFVLSGEVVIGGNQDRILGANTLIPAKTTMDVPVFCVEHGRSKGATKVFSTAKALAHGRLRANASYRDQDRVWGEVASMNALRNTKNATDTYRAVATQQTNGALATQEKKLAAGLAKISAADRKRMVGYVVALDGKIVTVDMFGSNALFAKLEPKLLKSYVTEALDTKVTSANVAPTAKTVKTFMHESTTARVERKHETAASTTSVQIGSTSANSSVDIEGGNLYRNYNSL